MVLEVVVREEVDDVPEPGPFDEGRPLRGIGRVDVVVLAEAVEGEGDGEDEKDRDDVELERDAPATDECDSGKDAELEDDREKALAGDAAAQVGLVGRGLFRRGAEVDRKKRRCEVKRFEPARVLLRREIVALGIVDRRAEGGVMIEMPLRELRGGDAAGDGVEKAEEAVTALARLG